MQYIIIAGKMVFSMVLAEIHKENYILLFQ
jgi:hypothetical protein